MPGASAGDTLAEIGPASDTGAPLYRGEIEARFVVRLIAFSCRCSEAEILGQERGASRISRARQIAIYLLHTSLSLAYGEIGRLFNRDRTTISHACRLIEDLRDDPKMDQFICELEAIIDLASSMWRRPASIPAPETRP
ncbi:MAG: helix-turn-helix domain-containing protein [Rhizobiaceae bacterium]